MDFTRTDCQTKGADKSRIIINVGGFRHETNVSTLQNIPDTRLAWIAENSSSSDEVGAREYFFDRHPTAFAQVLNFYRTGKLHCPAEMCGPMYEEELIFWGIDEKQMEPCCWGKYTQHREAEENLKAFVGPGFEDLRSPDKYSVNAGSIESFDQNRTKWRKLQPKMWAILDEPHSSRLAKAVSYMSCIFITVSIAIFCATTMPSIRDAREVMGTRKELFYIEMVCSMFFSVEFLMRFAFCPSKLRFIRGIMNWIDFVAIVPFFLSLITDHPVFRMIVVIRILRLFRFIKLSYGLQIMVQTLKASSHELILLLLMLLIPVVLFSSIVYYIEVILEKERSTFTSVPDSFWWCLITMTTVGYGDMTPNTWPGKVIGGACAVCGVLIVALPISVIGNNFNLYYAHAQARLKLPKKHRRLVLGGVPGLLSKQQELSSRRMKKKQLRDVDELCTSEEASSAMSSPPLQQRRARTQLNPTISDGETESLLASPTNSPLRRRRQRTDSDGLIDLEQIKDGSVGNGVIPSAKPYGANIDGILPVLNVTDNPMNECVDDSGEKPDNTENPDRQNDRLHPNVGLKSKRKLSLSDSNLSDNHRHRETPYRCPSETDTSRLSAKFHEIQPPRTRSVPAKDNCPLGGKPNKRLANGDCASSKTSLTPNDFEPRERTTTFPCLPEYNRNRRKGLSVAPSTSKEDPDFLETKI